jgi:hypothetical protein
MPAAGCHDLRMIGLSDSHSSGPDWLRRFIDYVEARLAREGSFRATVGEIQDAVNLPDGFYSEYLRAELDEPPFFSFSDDNSDRDDPQTPIRFE